MFQLTALGRYPVGYHECTSCKSLQTDAPFWLNEAYKIPGVHIDVGQAARVVHSWVRLNFILSQISFDKSLTCVDYGGSAGLLTRLMRDIGYNYYAFDAYENSKYANYFSIEKLTDRPPHLITAFEVFEHFPDPASSLKDIFSSGAEIIIFSADFYQGQGPDWGYLAPIVGQHVFFYSKDGLAQFRLWARVRTCPHK
jgi:hypothetical protein